MISTAPKLATTAMFSQLVDDVRSVARSNSTPQQIGLAVADLLKPCLGREDFIHADGLEPDPNEYRQHILHVEADGSFSVVALVWLPGQATPIHDHVSWCVVGVHTGAETEITYRLADDKTDPHLVVVARGTNPPGMVAALVPPGDIHEVRNAGDGLAVSIHIYGADIGVLGSSIRRRFDLEVRSPEFSGTR